MTIYCILLKCKSFLHDSASRDVSLVFLLAYLFNLYEVEDGCGDVRAAENAFDTDNIHENHLILVLGAYDAAA